MGGASQRRVVIGRQRSERPRWHGHVPTTCGPPTPPHPGMQKDAVATIDALRSAMQRREENSKSSNPVAAGQDGTDGE